jgi:glycosyltransferase involved in cell wall biosynthesis
MTHGAPQISVVLPVSNGFATIGAAVESILEQSSREWELIVVDDGSTDGTDAVLAGFSSSGASPAVASGHLRIVRTPHRGLVAALNTGLATATGDLIARMDADDRAHPDRLARQRAFLLENPHIGIVGSAAVTPPREGNAGYRRYTEWVNGLTHWRQIRRARFIESPLIHPTVMFRRDLVDRHGGYREGPFPEDYELWLRWFAAGVKAAALPEPLLIWNDPPERFSRTPTAMQDRDAFYRIKAEYLARAVGEARRGRAVILWGGGRRTRRRFEPFEAALVETAGTEVAAIVDVAGGATRPFRGRRVPCISPGEVPPAAGGVRRRRRRLHRGANADRRGPRPARVPLRAGLDRGCVGWQNGSVRRVCPAGFAAPFAADGARSVPSPRRQFMAETPSTMRELGTPAPDFPCRRRTVRPYPWPTTRAVPCSSPLSATTVPS